MPPAEESSGGTCSLLPGFPCTQRSHAPRIPRRPHRKETHPCTSFQEPNRPRAAGAGWDIMGGKGVWSPHCGLGARGACPTARTPSWGL